MLPIAPQSIFKIFLNSLRNYPKVFLLLMPVSLILVVSNQIIKLFAIDQNGWLLTSLTVIAGVLVGFFCFLWGIKLLYSLFTGEKPSYLLSFSLAAKRFFKALFIPAIWAVLSLLVVLALTIFTVLFVKSEIVYAALMMLVSILILLNGAVLISLKLVYAQEILLKNADVLSAVRLALRTTLKVKTFFRTLMLLILFGLSTVILMFPYFIMLLLSNWINIGDGLSSTILTVNIVLVTFLAVPLQTLLYLFYYNDLALRFGDAVNS